jgi:hypothetical protein
MSLMLPNEDGGYDEYFFPPKSQMRKIKKGCEAVSGPIKKLVKEEERKLRKLGKKKGKK